MPEAEEGIDLASGPTLSVILPTYNRKASLVRALDSLGRQTFPRSRFEVIVVDDGSTDGTQAIASEPFPFIVRCLHQHHQGATAARNLGARASRGDILVFMDDDVTISPQTLQALAAACGDREKALVMGTIHRRSCGLASVYTSVVLTMVAHTLWAHDDSEFHFADCNSELLACKRHDFFALEMFQDPTEGHGWPNWDDVDLGYRAHLQGFRLVGTSQAIAEHWDHSIADRIIACHRYFRTGRSAVWFFKRHPKMQALIPMLLDKTPLAWGQDPLGLMARKVARRLSASRPALAALVWLADVLEQHYPSPAVLRRLYDWLHGANLLRGYREGLRELQGAGGRS